MRVTLYRDVKPVENADPEREGAAAEVSSIRAGELSCVVAIEDKLIGFLTSSVEPSSLVIQSFSGIAT